MSVKYEDFYVPNYKPAATDVICTFRVESRDPQRSIAWTAGAVAAESSIGTWTELTTDKPYMKELAAKVFSIKGNTIQIAYPVDLFEPGNIPNLLSSVAGNVFGLGDLRYLRLLDIVLPTKYINSFPGPAFGMAGVRQTIKVPRRPLVGTIIKPKLGLRTKDHAAVAYAAWVGGCDVVKDDENLSSQRFNPFDDRVIQTLEQRDRAQEQTGERKLYLANVTAETKEMLRRAEFVKEHGGEVAMVDILTCGFAAVQSLRNQGLNLILHGHRAMHAAFTKLEEHGIAMPVIALCARLAGIDQLHVGTAVGKMSEGKEDVQENVKVLRSKLGTLKPMMAVASGGLQPGSVPALIDIFGLDVVIQAGGGIHGHPQGTEAGARAMRQAVDAVLAKVPLAEYAKTHPELAAALQRWPSAQSSA
jgi:ribulose-bisphosphate carboxylase large chain